MLLRDNDRIYVNNLENYLLFLEKSSYIAIKKVRDWVRPYNGAITIAEYFYYALRGSHISFFVYLREKFDSMTPIKESFDILKTSYPQIVWEMQMLSEYPLEYKNCYINSKEPIVYVPEMKEKSRTRNWYDSGVKEGRPINYTYEDMLYTEKRYLELLMKFYKNKNEILKIEYYFYCAAIFRATYGYYTQMHDSTHRYGVPYVRYSKKEWLNMSKAYYMDKLILLQTFGGKLKYRLLMKLISIYNKILVNTACFVSKKIYNPVYILNLVCMRMLRALLKSLEKIIL